MNYLDLFSGIGGFRLGLEQAGFKFGWEGHSEIDKYAEQIYQRHYPESECLGDVKAIDPTKLPKLNLITFGFPCQDISIAGKRGGLRASRSGLFFEAMRIIEVAKPDIFIFENVKGLFSSSEGRDFEIILRTIADLGVYDCEWQLLNTRWFLPQNRERIYFIGIRKDLQYKSIFPIIPDRYIREVEYEKVYEMSQGLSQIVKAFFERQEIQGQTHKMVQELFQRICKGIQQKKAKEIGRENEEIRQLGKESISEVETIIQRAFGNNNTGEVFGVVQIPTEEMLLLWDRGSESTYSFRFLQSEDYSFDNRQNGFPSWLRGRESFPMLLAVQFYKGKLFYSCGNGRNWTKIYIQEVGRCQQTLSDILEEQVARKYFLSEKAIKGLMKGQSKPQILDVCKEEDIVEGIIQE